jgi:DNA-binding transcriptional ArsR family regulator
MTNQDARLDALGDPTRRRILTRLRQRPLPVSRIAKGFRISRPAISQHLKVLKDAGLVVDRAEGTRRIYELNPAAFASLRQYFDEFWDIALQAFARRIEDDTANHP